MAQETITLIQLGQLISKCGLITKDDLANALDRAKERNLPVGTILLMMGLIRPAQLSAAVEAQALINDGQLPLEIGLPALMQVFSEECSFQKALEDFGWQPPPTVRSNRLGQLLLDSELLTEEQLMECLDLSADTGLPLGRVLLFRKFLTDSVLLAVLSTQRLIREGLASREQAIKGLKAVRNRKISIEESLAESGVYRAQIKKTPPLGYLLVEAGFLEQERLMLFVELSLSEGKELSELLAHQNLVPEKLCQSAEQAQHMVEKSTLEKGLAIAALKMVAAGAPALDQAIAWAGLSGEKSELDKYLNEVLVVSGAVWAPSLPAAAISESKTYDELKAKFVPYLLSEDLLMSALRAVHMISQKVLTVQDAAIVLNKCSKEHCSFDSVLIEMNWSPNKGRAN